MMGATSVSESPMVPVLRAKKILFERQLNQSACGMVCLALLTVAVVVTICGSTLALGIPETMDMMASASPTVALVEQPRSSNYFAGAFTFVVGALVSLFLVILLASSNEKRALLDDVAMMLDCFMQRAIMQQEVDLDDLEETMDHLSEIPTATECGGCVYITHAIERQRVLDERAAARNARRRERMLS